MNDLKERWVKALRSGRYEQTTGALLDEEGANCCLGVLCRVARVPREKWSDLGALTDFQGGLDLMQALGITQTDQTSLIELNDRQRKPFILIADWIEENL